MTWFWPKTSFITSFCSTLRKRFSREENFENFVNFGQIYDINFLIGPPKWSFCENGFRQNFSKLVILENKFPPNLSIIDELRIFEFLSNKMSLELGLLETIGYSVIYLSKKSIKFYWDHSQNHKLRSWRKCSLRQRLNLFQRNLCRGRVCEN